MMDPDVVRGALNGVGLKFRGRASTSRLPSTHGPSHTTNISYYWCPPPERCEQPSRLSSPYSRVLAKIFELALTTHPQRQSPYWNHTPQKYVQRCHQLATASDDSNTEHKSHPPDRR